MSIFDVALLIVLFGFIFYGLFFGFIRTLGGLVGVFVGAFFASRFYLPVSAWASQWFFGHDNIAKIIIFIVLFSLISKITGLVFYFIEKVFNIISIIPFLKTFNRLLGAVLGLLTGSLCLGLFIYLASRYSLINDWLGNELVNSKIAPYLLKVANLLLPFLPEMLKKLQSLM